jgi:anti-anti-sigma factor
LAGVLLIDVLEGMIIGVVASLVFVIYRSSRPHVSALGRVPGVPGAYSDLGRHPENTPVPGVLIARLDGQLYYANAPTFRDRVKSMIETMDPPPRAVILDANAWYEMDVTGVDTLGKLVKELQGKSVAVYLADVHAPVYKYADESGLLEIIGKGNVFPTVDAAVHQLQAAGQGRREKSE